MNMSGILSGPAYNYINTAVEVQGDVMPQLDPRRTP